MVPVPLLLVPLLLEVLQTKRLRGYCPKGTAGLLVLHAACFWLPVVLSSHRGTSAAWLHHSATSNARSFLLCQVPFVDEQRLLAAAKSVPSSRLTEAERARNKLGEMLVFEYKDGESYTSGKTLMIFNTRSTFPVHIYLLCACSFSAVHCFAHSWDSGWKCVP